MPEATGANANEKKANAPRKHHYVQQAHLALFADEKGLLRVLSKDDASFRTQPRNVFAERDLYSFDGTNGFETQAETELSKFESDLFPFLKEIGEGAGLSAEREDAARAYVACSVLRNPTHQQMVVDLLRSSIETMASALEARGEIEPMGGTGTRLDGQTLTQMLASGDVQIEINNAEYLRSFMELLETQVGLMQDFELSLLHSEAGSIAIGDHPVTFVHPGLETGPYGAPFGGPDCELTFPVSKHVALIGRWKSRPPELRSEEAVTQANIRQAMFTRRLLASAVELAQAPDWLSRYRHICFKAQVDRLPSPAGAYTIVTRALLPADERQRVWRDIKPIGTFG